VGRGDNQHLADARQHESAERVVDHWFVVYGQQLLADRLGDRMEATAATSGQDDAATLIGELSQTHQAFGFILSLGAPQYLVRAFLSGENRSF
jgi:hypothetical protein